MKDRPWRAPLILGLVTIVLGMAFSILHAKFIGYIGWGIPNDIWPVHDAAQYIANGALGYVYESTPRLSALVLWPILLAPAASIGQHFGLTGYPVAYPTMWLVLAPLGLATSTLVFYGGRMLARQLSAPGKDGWTMLALMVLAVFRPAQFGHYEDILAVAFVLLAVLFLLRERWPFAAFLIGIAIGFKQWAILGVPLLIAATPRGSRLKGVILAALVPGFLFLFPLLADWEHASFALLRPYANAKFGHPMPWIAEDTVVFVGPFRLISIALATLLGFISLDRGDARYLFAAFGLAFATRLISEPIAHSYYLAPALAFFVLHERLRSGRQFWTVALGVPLLLMFGWFPNPWLWWGLFLLGLGVISAPSVREVLVTLRKVRHEVEGSFV